MLLLILAALLVSITPFQRDVFNWDPSPSSSNSMSRFSACHHLSQSTDSDLIYDFKPITGLSGILTPDDRPRSPSARLARFAPNHRDWVLYDAAQEDKFLSWWLETDYGQQLTRNGKHKFRWSVEWRSSKVWKHFDQVAELRSGRPKVVCRSCLTPLNYPHLPHHKSHGTTTMGKHLKSK